MLIIILFCGRVFLRLGNFRVLSPLWIVWCVKRSFMVSYSSKYMVGFSGFHLLKGLGFYTLSFLVGFKVSLYYIYFKQGVDL